MSYRHGMLNGGWHVDQADKDNELLFPKPTILTSMKSDRIFADPYSANLEFQVNDMSPELTVLNQTSRRRMVQVHAGERDIYLDCEYLECVQTG